jgi:ERF superfamily protein
MSETPEVAVLEQVWEVAMSPVWSGALVKALAAAQLEYKPVLKQQENEAFRRGARVSKYADLAEYIDATQEALAKHGLVVTQWPDVSTDAKAMSLTSFLMHESGEWMRGRLTLPALGRDGFTAQSCGSSITYARRYSYGAITGCASEDDDGNSASGRGTSEAAQAVGERKVAELKEKAKKTDEAPSGPVLSLFWVWHNESQSATIEGAESLKKLNKDVLGPLWNGAARAIIANAEQLEDLKFKLEKRGVPFAALKAANA